MNMPIACRSPAEILMDQHIDAFLLICRDLNAVCNGVCLFRGEKRQKLLELKERCAAYVDGVGEPVPYLFDTLIRL